MYDSQVKLKIVRKDIINNKIRFMIHILVKPVLLETFTFKLISPY